MYSTGLGLVDYKGFVSKYLNQRNPATGMAWMLAEIAAAEGMTVDQVDALLSRAQLYGLIYAEAGRGALTNEQLLDAPDMDTLRAMRAEQLNQPVAGGIFTGGIPDVPLTPDLPPPKVEPPPPPPPPPPPAVSPPDDRVPNVPTVPTYTPDYFGPTGLPFRAGTDEHSFWKDSTGQWYMGDLQRNIVAIDHPPWTGDATGDGGNGNKLPSQSTTPPPGINPLILIGGGILLLWVLK